MPDLIITTTTAEDLLGHILGARPAISELKRLQHPGTGAVYRITVPRHPVYLLKSYPIDLRPSPRSRPFWDTESRNLDNVNPISTVRKPHYFGRYQNYFLEEFIDGELFEGLLESGRLEPDTIQTLFKAALDQLVNLHTGAASLRDRRLLHRSFEPGRLIRTLTHSRHRIEQDGFPAYTHRGFKLNLRWREALENLPQDQLLADLTTTHSYILGHGDFKPNNLIVKPDRQIAVVDWLGLGKAQPWYDLAYLLNSAPPNQRATLANYYLEQMKTHGLLMDITTDHATQLRKSGSIYQELVRARSNSRYIGTRTDPHHVNEFTTALDGLANLVLGPARKA